MGRTCTICSHQNCKDIDRAVVEGLSLRDIGRQFATTKDAIKRHIDAGHISTKIKAAKEIAGIRAGLGYVEYAEEMVQLSRSNMLESQKSDDIKEKCLGIETHRKVVESYGKATGEIPATKQEITGKDGSGFIINLTTASFRKAPDDT